MCSSLTLTLTILSYPSPHVACLSPMSGKGLHIRGKLSGAWLFASCHFKVTNMEMSSNFVAWDMSLSWVEFSGDRPVAWSAVQRWHWLLRHSEGENCQKVYSQLLAGSNSLVEARKMGWSGVLVNAITAQLLPSAACSIMSASPQARLATAGRLTSGPTSIQPPS